MTETETALSSDAEELARRIVDRTGGEIRLALPLGLGKANGIVNALTRAARDDPAISLTILTAIALKPACLETLEMRLSRARPKGSA